MSRWLVNNLELNLDSVVVNNPFLTVILGDLNAKLSFWYNNDELHMKDPKLMVQPPNLDYHK